MLEAWLLALRNVNHERYWGEIKEVLAFVLELCLEVGN